MDVVTRRDLANPVFQAFSLLRLGFSVAPILFGLDKLPNWLVDWRIYLAPEINDLIPGNAHQAMLAIGASAVGRRAKLPGCQPPDRPCSAAGS